MITKKYYKLIRVSYEDLNYLTLTNTGNSTGLFSVSKYGSPSTTNLEYSINGVDWTTYDLTNLPTVEVPVDGNIYLRGTNANGFNTAYNNYCRLAMSTSFTVKGNPFSLRNIDPAVFSTYTSVLNYEFYGLFENSTTITSASGLITSQITSIGNNSFCQMFNGCSNLTTPFDLSGLTNVNYNSCNKMFQSCANLTTTPEFRSLRSIGEQSFYNMFSNCASLTKGPDLSEITNVDKNGCNNLFSGCSRISEVTAPNISDWGTNKMSSWLVNAGGQATGTKIVYAPTGLEIPANTNGIPSGWTRVDY